MLVLSRCSGEVLRLVDLGTITVLEIRENKVRLGLEFPKGVVILREELWLETKNNHENA